MAIPPIFIPPIWGAFPPEVNTSRLMAGAGPAPMLQAAAGWEVLAVSLETQADELAASLASLAQMWQGMGSERAITALRAAARAPARLSCALRWSAVARAAATAARCSRVSRWTSSPTRARSSSA